MPITADKMYDTDTVFKTLDAYFPLADIVIPPKNNTFADESHHPKRMTNLINYCALGVTRWQRYKHYGRRNVSETAMQRYKKIIGPKLHSRKFNKPQQFGILEHYLNSTVYCQVIIKILSVIG